MLVTLLIVLLLLVALLAVPVSVDFRVNYGLPDESEVFLVWAFGLVRVRASGRAGDESTEVEAAEDEPATERSSPGANPLAALKQREFRQRVLRFARDLWRAVRKENIRVYARLGLGDPADTGQLWALLGPVSGVLRDVEGASIELEPDFSEASAIVDSRGRVTVVPLQIVGITLGLALSPPFWRGIRAMRA